MVHHNICLRRELRSFFMNMYPGLCGFVFQQGIQCHSSGLREENVVMGLL